MSRSVSVCTSFKQAFRGHSARRDDPRSRRTATHLPASPAAAGEALDGSAPDSADSWYCESIDFDDARHPQTMLAYELNGHQRPVGNVAPLRCRVERQRGYKQAKYLRSIEVVDTFKSIRGGRGGYWEDEGDGWYAGI